MYWQYDSRLGRRWNRDPVFVPSESPYLCFGDNPILYTDPNGDFKRKFWAKMYAGVMGGEVRQDKGGEYYVDKRVEYSGEGAGVEHTRRFNWSGRNVGRDLAKEATQRAAENWVQNYEFKRSMRESGFEVVELDPYDARWRMIGFSTDVLIPNPIFKETTIITNSIKATKESIKSLKISKRLSFMRGKGYSSGQGKMGRHLSGHPEFVEGKSFFNSIDDAQTVLDSYHSGNTTILKVVNENTVIVKCTEATGYFQNMPMIRAGKAAEATNVFQITGTSQAKIVPMNPVKY